MKEEENGNMKYYGEYMGWKIYILSGQHPAYKATKIGRKTAEYADSLRDIKSIIYMLSG